MGNAFFLFLAQVAQQLQLHRATALRLVRALGHNQLVANPGGGNHGGLAHCQAHGTDLLVHRNL